MSEETRTYSESWYRIADQRVALRPNLKVRRRYFRGERWYVLYDTFLNQFFRLRPAAYDFLARLRQERTVEQVWHECVERDPAEAPGQEDVIRLLSQLYAANLLHSNLAPDSSKLFERYTKRRQREIKSRFLSIMFARFPLLDPDQFLKAALPVIGKLISPIGALIWCVVVGAGIKVAFDNWPALQQQSEGVLAPGNLFLLFVGMVLSKMVHEFGHAFFCRKFGGEVHVMGVMLMIFTPMPYMDATSSWSFRSRWQRALVGAAGMISELFLAAGATFIWANTGAGTIHSLAYNMMFVASVSTVLFNANPLLRYDGYYILSDLLDIPNLHTRAIQQLTHLVEYYGFGCKKSRSPALSATEAWWITVFGIASGIYRVLVFSMIALFVADRYFILGVLMAFICLISWVIVPAGKLIHYLAASPKLERTRGRAVALTVGAFALVLFFLDWVPFPNHFRAPGILEAVEHTVAVNETPGYMEKMVRPSGSKVARGEPLVQLRDKELELEIAQTAAEHNEANAQQLRAMQQQTADLKPIKSRLEMIERRQRYLEEKRASLTVRAQHEGIWVAPEVKDYVGSWLHRGTPLGQIVNPASFHFSAIVSQNEASRLFTREIREGEVRLFGQVGIVLPVSSPKIIPADREDLPSAALGWSAGGEVPVAAADAKGTKASEPFFEVLAPVLPRPEALLFHGRSGKIRFDLAPEPLLKQWVRKFRQLLQKRYSI